MCSLAQAPTIQQKQRPTETSRALLRQEKKIRKKCVRQNTCDALNMYDVRQAARCDFRIYGNRIFPNVVRARTSFRLIRTLI